MHLTEAEQVGAFDDQRVHRRHVDARLDDRGAHQHVVLAVPEVLHDGFERAFVHLAVGDRDARLGHELAQASRGGVDRLHPVVHPEHLALTEEFAADRLDRDALVVLADVGEDRHAIGRRGLQQRQVADADERHLQRARDRRGGEREDVDVRLHLLHRLLVLHAEALLLVDDQQAEILELHVVREQPVRADDAVDLAGLDALDHLLGLAGREEPRQRLDTDGEPGESVGERVAVLCCEQRRRREDGDLLAVLDRLERGPDGDLGLAETDVAAQQPVHRVSKLHVALDRLDRRALVGRLDVRKRLFHLVLPGCVLGERVALGVDALLVEHDEFLGDLAHRRADLALGLREVGAAEAVQLRCLAADVLAQRVDLVGRHVELVAALVRDQQVVALDAADRPLDHALVLADTVLVVHDVVAGLEVLERRRRLALLLAHGAVGAASAGEIALGDDRHLGVRQGAATVQRSDGDAAAGLQVGARTRSRGSRGRC